MMTTILASVMVSPEYFFAGKMNLRSWSMDHPLESDNGWNRKFLVDTVEITTPITYQRRFFCEYQTKGAL
jgi:hypothetical protein